MEEFLQRSKSKLNRSKRLEKVHVVIGRKSCDLDSLISTFTYAYFLEKVSPPGVLCLPVLNIPRTEFNYFTETRFILEELNISESLHIFRDEINLHQLNNEGKLSLTLVGSNVLASEDSTLESAVVKVINPIEQSNAGLESSSSLVVSEILREAPELITEQLAHLLRGSILFQYMTMESEKISEKQEEILSILEEKFPNLPPREDIIRVLQDTQSSAQGLSIEQTILKDLKELSDGEIKVAVSTVTMTLESCTFHKNILSDLKAFTDRYGFDILILLVISTSEEQQPRRQLAVYSENLELCSQICCELEECQNPCLELEPFECGCDEILVYQQENPSVTCDQVLLLVKEVINRRCSEMVSNSRTSSTEAVAGSAPLSQGSSGIMELYGSDIEPQPSSVNFIENPPDLNDSNQAQVDVNIDLVSPDSGLATIRSSRSSKESSVFLSDDSPVGEGSGPHHSLLPGFDSYSPIPEGAIAEEHTRSAEHGEHFDLFNFDSAPMVSGQSQPSSHSADFSPEDDFFPNSDSSEGQLPTGPKGLDEMGINMSSYSSSSLLSTTGKDSLMEFDEEFVQRQESPRDNCEHNLNLTDFVRDDSPTPEKLRNSGERIPPTAMNSLAESSPSSEERVMQYPEDITKSAVDTGHTGPPQARARCSSWWGGLEIDSKTVGDAWSSSKQESAFQNPESWKDNKPSSAERRASDSVFQPKSHEFSKSGLWESEFGQPVQGSGENQDQMEGNAQLRTRPTEKAYLSNSSPQGTNHLIEDFSALWHSDRSPTAMPEPWGNPTDESDPVHAGAFPAWSAFGEEDDNKALKNTWNLHPMSGETPSVMDPNEWTMAKSGFSFPSEHLADRSPGDANNEITPKIWGKKNNDSRDTTLVSGNPTSSLDHAWNHSKALMEDQNGLIDPTIRGKAYEKVDSWNLFEDSNKKRGSDILAPWEDSFLSYKCSDYSTSNIGEESVASPLDTNYSTSDSYTSPTFAGDEKEMENKPFNKEDRFETKDANSTTEEPAMPPQSPEQLSRNRISSGPGNLEMWAFSHADDSPETNSTQNPDKDFLQTEHLQDKNISVEDDAGDSSLSSYDDPRMMQLYNETNRQLTLLHSSTNSRQGQTDNDLWNKVILEDTQSTATISDMDNDLDWDDCSGGVALSSEGQAQGYAAEGTEPETRFSVRQLEPWSVEYPEANQVDWELPASSEPSKETAPNQYNILNEKSGQLIANNIWDSVMRDNTMTSFMLSSPSHIPNAEQSKMASETPGSSEKVKDIHIPDVLNASGISLSGAHWNDSDNGDTSGENLQSDSASLATRLENPGHFAPSDLWKGHSFGHSGSEKEALGAADGECVREEEVRSSEEDSASGCSEKGESDQELSSPVASKHQNISMETDKVSALSGTSCPQTDDLEGILEHEKRSFHLDSWNVQTGMCTNDLQANLTEATEIPERRNLTENVSLLEMAPEKTTENNILEPEKMNEIPPQALSQNPDIWDDPKETDVQVHRTGSEISKNLDIKAIENSLPGASSPGNYGKSSISSECTHSSTSSPDLNDSSAALLPWSHMPNTDHKTESRDDWSGQSHQESEVVSTDGQVERNIEMKEPEKIQVEELEKSFEHKVPKFLEIWNNSVEGDSLSSLSSPETGKYSEYSGAHQERNLKVSHQGRNKCEILETVHLEDSKFNSTSSCSDNDSTDDEEAVEKESQVVTFQGAQSESGAWSSLNESNRLLSTDVRNIQESLGQTGSSEPAGNEEESNQLCDNQQSSPDHWNFSPPLDPLNGSNKFLVTAEPSVQECTEHLESSEPAKNENESKTLYDNHQSSPDHWNFSPPLNSLDKSKTILAADKPNIQEHSECLVRSESAENETKSTPLYDYLQSSSDHWNFSPRLHSVKESTKFLSNADPKVHECSEFVTNSAKGKDGNKSGTFYDGQQSSPDHWHFSPLSDSRNESNEILAKVDPKVHECSEYVGNSEPEEDGNKSDPFYDDQQSSPDHWNFSPQSESRNESHKILTNADPKVHECSEFVTNSEPEEDGNMSGPFSDDQQSSPSPWNFSSVDSLGEPNTFSATTERSVQGCSEPAEDENKPNPYYDDQPSRADHKNLSSALFSLDESSKFSAKTESNVQECEECIDSSEPAEDENKTNSFYDDQQRSPNYWTVSPQLASSPKFLATGDLKTQDPSEYVGNSEPAENENKTNLFCEDQQRSPDHWNLSTLKETEMRITVDRDTKSFPEAVNTGDAAWQESPQSEPQTENSSKLESLGFSAESTEWWVASPQEGRPIEKAFEGQMSNLGDVLETNSSRVYHNMDPWRVAIPGDIESTETQNTIPFKDKQQSTFLDSNGKNSHELLWNIQPKEPDLDADEHNQQGLLDQIKEKDSRDQIFVASAGDELTSETHTQEQWQDTLLPDENQPDQTFTGENEWVTPHVSTFECQETNWWEQEKSYTSDIENSSITSENVPVVSSPTQSTKKSDSGWNDSTPSEDPQGTFVPDILHGSFQEAGQLASASPDLWMDAKQPFGLKADGENPDILTHCDHESNSQASNSPDIYHEYEAKQETEHHASAWMGPEVESSELYVTEPNTDEEPNQKLGQEFVPYNSGLYSENTIPLPVIRRQENSSDISQSASHEASPEPSEINDESNTEFKPSETGTSLDAAPVFELSDRSIPVVEHIGTSIIVTEPKPALYGGSSWISENLVPESQRDLQALLDHGQPATKNPAPVTETLLVSDPCLDVNEAFEHSFSEASGLNTSTGTIDDMSKLTLSEGNPETPVDGDAGKQDICSSEASWGDFEYDIMGQNIDEDLMKEPDHFLYSADPPLEEDVWKQPLAPYTPPFDLSHLTEPSPGAEKVEAGSLEDESLGSDAAELLLSAPPDGRGKENHTEDKSGPPELQLTALHIHEDSESLSLPVRGGSDVELSPSNDGDWDVETDYSCSPEDGGIGPPDGTKKRIFEEERVVPNKDLEHLTSEYQEERGTEKNETRHVLHMDYILVNHEEEHLPQKPEACEARGSTFELENSHTSSEKMWLPETPLASSPGIFKSTSLNDRKDHSLESMVSKDKKSPESPGQDQDWMLLGHSEVGDLPLERDSSQLETKISGSGWSPKTIEPASDPSPGKGYQTQVLEVTKPLESLALEEACSLNSQSRKTKNQDRAGPDAVLLPVVTHDNEWEMLSPQASQKNMIPESEMEEETAFLEARIGKPRPNRLLPEDVGMDIPFEQRMLSPSAADMRPEPPNSLDLNGSHPRRIKLTAPNINLSLDQSEGSILSDDNLDSPDEIDINVDELDTPDEADSFEYTGHEDPTANKDSGQESESIPEYTAEEEREDNRLWRTVVIGEQEQRIDMKVIEPYRRVISHGGYYGDGLNAIIVFAACFLPDSSRADYHYVMENLFLYVISTLELMVAEDYMIVYLNGATPRRKMPGLGWMKKCYQMIDRRLRKNLKSFIIVHPSWFIRTILAVTRPFISSKFSSKIKYVSSLSELSGLIPMDCIHIPESIIKYDEEKSYKRSVRLDEELREASEAANIDLKLKDKP